MALACAAWNIASSADAVCSRGVRLTYTLSIHYCYCLWCDCVAICRGPIVTFLLASGDLRLVLGLRVLHQESLLVKWCAGAGSPARSAPLGLRIKACVAWCLALQLGLLCGNL